MSDELSTAMVAKRLRVTVHAVRWWVRHGRLKPVRREGLLTYWFSRADVDQFTPPTKGRPRGSKNKKKK